MLIPWHSGCAHVATRGWPFRADLSAIDDNNTKLLIHSNTTDGSTTFTDSSNSGHTVDIGAATVEHDTAQKVFGTSSILFDGTGYLSIADHADWNFGTGAFTIEFCARPTGLANSSIYEVMGQMVDINNYVKVIMTTDADGGAYFSIYVKSATVDLVSDVHAPTITTLSQDVWSRIAFVRSGDIWYSFVNGILTDTETHAITCPDLSIAWCIGDHASASAALPYIGWLDEIRIGKGVARHTTYFILPLRAY